MSSATISKSWHSRSSARSLSTRLSQAKPGRVETGAVQSVGNRHFVFILGAGLSFIFGPVGLLLMLAGIGFAIWGALITWLKG